MSNKLNMSNKSSDKTKITSDYIRGLIEGHGSFGFTSSGSYGNKTPSFQLKMTIDNKDILEQTKNYLGLKNKIYEYRYRGKEKSKRRKQAILIVRDFQQLKDIIIPFFYKKLKGHRGKQFVEWLEAIGKDPDVSNRFKSLYRLYKWGIYDKDPKFTQKYV